MLEAEEEAVIAVRLELVAMAAEAMVL